MARPPQDREIQVQKPAQSLAHFQSKLAQGQETEGALLKHLIRGGVALLLLGLLGGGWSAWRAHTIEKHEAALAALQMEVEGEGVTPVAAAEIEKRMRERLGRLEALATSAPSTQKAVTQGLLDAWRLSLEGKGPGPVQTKDPWGRIRLAQRALALGQVQEARVQLDPLRAKAKPGEAWSEAFWSSQMEANRLAGDRAQALKDLAEYKARFKGRGDAAQLESMLQSI